jgi:trk system potassium uptake protein TrkA
MKIIIAGDGKVGSTLARELSAEGYDLTVIDSRRQVLEHTMEKYDLLAVNGNCAAMNTLQQAGVERPIC